MKPSQATSHSAGYGYRKEQEYVMRRETSAQARQCYTNYKQAEDVRETEHSRENCARRLCEQSATSSVNEYAKNSDAVETMNI